MKPESFSRNEHIRKRREFLNVYQNGKSVSKKSMKFYVMTNNLEYTRLGVTVPRRTGKAVVRNRYRRWIKELFRRNKSCIRSGIDLVVCVFSDQWNDFISFHEDFFKLLRRTRLLKR